MVNPFCEIAIEEALRIKEKQADSEVVLVSVGGKVAQEQLRTGLAMGADRAVLVVSEDAVDPAVVARVIKKLIEAEQPDLVLMGNQAIDDDSNVVGQMVAEMLGWAQATNASALKLADGNKSAVVTREVDGGLETVELKLPAIVTVDLRLNTPRYASLPNIMKAKKKPLDVLKPADLGVDVKPRVTVVKVSEPAARKAGVKVKTVAELVEKLKNEAKVI